MTLIIAFIVSVETQELLHSFSLSLVSCYSLLERVPFRTYVRFCIPSSSRLIELTTCVIIAVMVVGALIFVLGLDLVKEALWDTRHRTSRYIASFLSVGEEADKYFCRTEYITIISIMVCM
jgi:hypothetical protein